MANSVNVWMAKDFTFGGICVGEALFSKVMIWGRLRRGPLIESCE